MKKININSINVFMFSEIKKIYETNIINKIIHNKDDNKNDNNLNKYSIEYKFITKFRKQRLEERIKISENILLKHQNRYPIIIDGKQINIIKNKYIVPGDLTLGQFSYILRKNIQLNEFQSIFLICENTLVFNTDSIYNLYNIKKDYDGFLYIIVSLENTFGNFIYLKNN